jgi:CHAT domain-containing protein
VVFLAVCGSLGGPIGRGSAASSLARPFLSAGVPTVVGTLWRVDDDATRRLAVSFHRFLRQGLTAAAALRAAQLDALTTGHDDKAAPTWAAFQVLGS